MYKRNLIGVSGFGDRPKGDYSLGPHNLAPVPRIADIMGSSHRSIFGLAVLLSRTEGTRCRTILLDCCADELLVVGVKSYHSRISSQQTSIEPCTAWFLLSRYQM